MKKVLFIILIAFNLYGSTCYTAVNGFKAIGTISAKFAERAGTSLEVFNEMKDAMDDRSEKLERIANLEKNIRLMKESNYKKSNEILTYLKMKKELLDIGISSTLMK